MDQPDQPIVLCTLPINRAGVALLEKIARVIVAPDPSPGTLRRMIGDADVLLVRTQLPDDLFQQPNRLLGVVRHGTGLDFIPVRSATALGIPVANVPGANVRAVVEYCLASFLLLSRHFTDMNGKLHAEGWDAARAYSVADSELFGKTVGIVGMGMIGTALGQACHYGFGMHVITSHPHAKNIPAFAECVDLERLFARSDFISLNCSLNDTTRHLVNAERLALMKSGAIIVNASRGAVIDDEALIEVLRSRKIKGAALDVFVQQPLASDHPFLKLDNVILTPHAAALTQESTESMSVGAARQVLRLLAGERPEHLVNPEVWQNYLDRRRATGTPHTGC